MLSDNYHGGELAAQFIEKTLADRAGVQEVAVIGLNPTTSVNGPRTDGFTQTVAKNANIKVVANISGHQTLEGGFKAAQAILAANPKVAAIYCENDSMAAGAGQAIEQAGGRNPLTNPVLVGFNGDPIALKLMQDGKLAADVAQNPYQQGVVAVDMAWDYLNGKTPKFTDAATKTVNVPVELVTPQTLPAFMERVKAGQAYWPASAARRDHEACSKPPNRLSPDQASAAPACASGSAASKCCTASISSCVPAKCTRWWARTAPARARSSTC